MEAHNLQTCPYKKEGLVNNNISFRGRGNQARGQRNRSRFNRDRGSFSRGRGNFENYKYGGYLVRGFSSRGFPNRGRGRSFKNISETFTRVRPDSGHPGRGRGQAPQANQTGMNRDFKSGNTVEFVADSGATEHIVRKNLMLSNFRKSENEVIKCPNKNNSADIMIDGRGDLVLYSELDENKLIKLSNVISAGDISENLISLRQFAEAGLETYLDSRILKIFDKNTHEIYLSGCYSKPNWIISLNLNDEYNLEKPRYNQYTCKARIGTLEELLTQPPAEKQILELRDSEGELDVRENNTPEVGRESNEKLEVKNRNHDNKLNENTDFDLNENILGRKILDGEKLGALDKISQKYNDEPLNRRKQKLQGRSRYAMAHTSKARLTRIFEKTSEKSG